MKKLTFVLLASTFALAACDEMNSGSQETVKRIDYSNQTCDQLKSLAAEKAQMAGLAHQNDDGAAAQAVVGTVGGVAAAAPVAGMALTAGAIAADQEDRAVDDALKSQYNDIINEMAKKNCM